MDCKKALTEAEGDFDKALEILRKKGMQVASKRAGRTASEGQVASYIHMGGKVGVLVEINCESDFVAKSEHFNDFVRDVAMHIAAASPDFVCREEVPAGSLDKERAFLTEQALATGKPAAIVEKIVDGKISKYYEEHCLLEQPFVKDTDKTIQQLLEALMARTGEKCEVRRFARFQLGEEL
jgi:elongation factor Ts